MNIDTIQSGSFVQQAPPRDLAPRQAAPENAENTPVKAPERSDKAETQDSATNKQPSVDDAVKRLSEFISASRPDISFTIDQASGKQVVKVLDSQTHDVIRQIPSEEAIQIASALDKLQGLFVKDKA
jgi:flagellar protein FlaG